jgi:hypothetical protein
LRPGIGSSIGKADNTPIIARHPATTNKAMLGARMFMEPLKAFPRTVTRGGNQALNSATMFPAQDGLLPLRSTMQ